MYLFKSFNINKIFIYIELRIFGCSIIGNSHYIKMPFFIILNFFVIRNNAARIVVLILNI